MYVGQIFLLIITLHVHAVLNCNLGKTSNFNKLLYRYIQLCFVVQPIVEQFHGAICAVFVVVVTSASNNVGPQQPAKEKTTFNFKTISRMLVYKVEIDF